MPRLCLLQINGLTSLKYGAGEHAMVELARQARERGHQSHVVWEFRPASEAFLRDFHRAGGILHVRRTPGRVARSVVAFSQLIRRIDADFVHCHFNPAVLPGLLAARIMRKPSLLSIHQMLMPKPGDATLNPRSLALAHARVALAHHVDAVSEASRRAYLERGIDRRDIEVHYLGAADPVTTRTRRQVRSEFAIAKSATVVICVAFHGPVKGVDLLLRAFARVAQQRPDWVLMQVGAGEQTQALHALADELGIADRVVWAGLRDDVPDLLAAADLYVQPSRNEGLGLALVEAASMGLARIGTNQGGIPEVLTHDETGVLVPPNDVPALADAIVDLGSDAKRRKTLGKAAKRFARERFHMATQTSKLLDKYERIVAEHRS